MSNLNIIDKLGIEKQEITVAEGKTYEIDCAAKTMVKAQEIFKKDSSYKGMFEVIELLLGSKAKNELDKMNLTTKQLRVVILAIMAQVNEVSYEEMERRFQKSVK